jgi:hypothetical protein
MRFSITLLALPGVLLAQSQEARLSVHGYLTQGYGVSRGGMVTGLTDQGTSDYRRAAILARYDVSSTDRFVVQLAHRRLGESPTMQFEDNVKLDMAFYEHTFGTGTRVRVGKSVMPFGIFNETRYAGTVLPLYRAPMAVYWEGTYTPETFDGAMLSHGVRAGEPWGVTLDAYAGSYDFLEFGTVPVPSAPPRYVGARMSARDMVAGQLWLTTPLEGLRLGLHGRTERHLGGVYPRPGSGFRTQTWLASVDGDFERWDARSEVLHMRTNGVDVSGYYGQVGVRPLERVGVNAQSEVTDISVLNLPTGTLHMKVIRDNALGVNLFLTPRSVFKLEAHRTNGLNLEQPILDYTGTIRGSYFLSSFSVSF